MIFKIYFLSILLLYQYICVVNYNQKKIIKKKRIDEGLIDWGAICSNLIYVNI